jgi:hypothetical protein
MARKSPAPTSTPTVKGYGDKWAIPAPADIYPHPRDLFSTFEAFMRHCNIACAA